MTQRPARVLLGVEQALFAQALQSFLEPRFRVVGIAASGGELVQVAVRERPDVIVTDIDLPGFGGPKGLHELSALCPKSRLVAITQCSTAALVRELFAAGVGALLLESSGPAELVFAVEEALAGLPYVTPGATQALLDALPAGAPDTGEPPLRVLLIDSYALVRSSIGLLLGKACGVEVVGECGDGREGVRRAVELRPDVVLMDVRLPGMNGAEVTVAIRAERPEVQILLMASVRVGPLVLAAVRAGARGYVSKTADQSELVAALRAVARGETWMPAEISRQLLEQAHQGLPAELTPRELEVAARVAEGLSNQQIGERLLVAEGTVRTHLRNIFEKLGIDSRLELALYALQEGWASLDDWCPCRRVSGAGRAKIPDGGAAGRAAPLRTPASPETMVKRPAVPR